MILNNESSHFTNSMAQCVARYSQHQYFVSVQTYKNIPFDKKVLSRISYVYFHYFVLEPSMKMHLCVFTVI